MCVVKVDNHKRNALHKTVRPVYQSRAAGARWELPGMLCTYARRLACRTAGLVINDRQYEVRRSSAAFPNYILPPLLYLSTPHLKPVYYVPTRWSCIARLRISLEPAAYANEVLERLGDIEIQPKRV